MKLANTNRKTTTHKSGCGQFLKITLRFWPVYLRNFLVWKKLMLPSIVGHIAEPLIWIVAFGFGMGALVGHVAFNGLDVPYILFLSSGSICMSVMNATSFEALYSVFSRLQMQKTWDGILNSPIELVDIIKAELLWSTTKGVISALFISLVVVLLGISHSPKILVAIFILMLLGLCFSSIALCMTAISKSYDFFTFYFTLVLTPMMFLSGVFFPLGAMPLWLQKFAEFLPLTAGIELVRPLFIGVWPATWLQPILLIVVYTVVVYWIAIALFRRRFAK